MYWEYLKHVLSHKWYVFKECKEEGMILRGILHDISKFLPSEFIPYARFIYGDYPEYEDRPSEKYKGLCKQDVEMRFNKAKLLHYNRNPHHYQFWLFCKGKNDHFIIPMPLRCLKEMICDWRGTGIGTKGHHEAYKWYEENKDNIILNRVQRRWVEKKIRPDMYSRLMVELFSAEGDPIEIDIQRGSAFKEKSGQEN